MSDFSLGMEDSYKLYKKNNKKGVSYKVYRDIFTLYIKYLVDKLMKGETVTLPERMGALEFVGKKMKPKLDENGNITGLSPDWQKTNELWNRCPECKERKELVFFFNENTQGIRYRIKWSKKRVFVENKEFYTFKLSIGNKEKFIDRLRNGQEFIVESKS